MRIPGFVALSLVLIAVAGCSYFQGEKRKDAIIRVAGPAGSVNVDDGGNGDGVTVVLVHSFGGNSGHWSNQLKHLRQSRRAVTLDLRGHGQSRAPASGDYAVDSFAQDIGAAIEGLGLERFVLVGHSLGGAAATAYAGAHPARVAGLVLVGTPGKSPPEMGAKIMTAMEADYEKVSQDYWTKLLTGARPETRTRIMGEMNSVPKDASLAIIRGVFAYDPLPALQAYPGPKLIIATPSEDGPGSLHQQAPEIRYETIANASHWVQLDQPVEFNAKLDAFLAQIDAANSQ